jgi:hypothetical protein
MSNLIVCNTIEPGTYAVKEIVSNKRNNDLAQDYVKSLFDYNQITGDLIRKIRTSNKVKIGDIAGSLNKSNGYYHVMIGGKAYKKHRIIFLWHHGYLPDYIDHIDRDRSNNRIENLREVTNKENVQNRNISKKNTSGVTGVYFDKCENMWRACISIEGKRTYIGRFKTLEEATKVRKDAELRYYTHAPK